MKRECSGVLVHKASGQILKGGEIGFKNKKKEAMFQGGKMQKLGIHFRVRKKNRTLASEEKTNQKNICKGSSPKKGRHCWKCVVAGGGKPQTKGLQKVPRHEEGCQRGGGSSDAGV